MMTTTTDRFADRLQALDVPLDRPELLQLLPVCHVAWANGHLAPRQRRRLQRLARHYLRLSARDARRFVTAWFDAPPTPEVVAEGCALLHDLAAAPDEPAVTYAALAHLQVHAEWVARAKPRAVDAPEAITSAEAEALSTIRGWLAVDMGEPWSRILSELEPAPPMSWRAA